MKLPEESNGIRPKEYLCNINSQYKFGCQSYRSLERISMRHIYQLSFFFTLVVIEYLATTTRELEVVAHSWDKLNHLAAFAVLYILLSSAFGSLNIWTRVMLLMAFAVQIELVQHFIPGRYFSFLDIVADGVGIACGWILIHGRWVSKLSRNGE